MLLSLNTPMGTLGRWALLEVVLRLPSYGFVHLGLSRQAALRVLRRFLFRLPVVRAAHARVVRLLSAGSPAAPGPLRGLRENPSVLDELHARARGHRQVFGRDGRLARRPGPRSSRDRGAALLSALGSVRGAFGLGLSQERTPTASRSGARPPGCLRGRARWRAWRICSRSCCRACRCCWRRRAGGPTSCSSWSRRFSARPRCCCSRRCWASSHGCTSRTTKSMPRSAWGWCAAHGDAALCAVGRAVAAGRVQPRLDHFGRDGRQGQAQGHRRSPARAVSELGGRCGDPAVRGGGRGHARCPARARRGRRLQGRARHSGRCRGGALCGEHRHQARHRAAGRSGAPAWPSRGTSTS
jgi:hypothetical protein